MPFARSRTAFHTSDGWGDYNDLGGGSNRLERIITLDSVYMSDFVKSASASGFTAVLGAPYTSGNKTYVKLTCRNNTTASVSLTNVFTYIEAEDIFDTDQEHTAVVNGTNAWISNETRYTSGITSGGVVVAAYMAQNNIAVAADGVDHEYPLLLANSTTDASGNDYDDRAVPYLCCQKGAERLIY